MKDCRNRFYPGLFVMESLEYLSSGGLRILLAVEQLLEERDGSMEVIHASDYILEVFDLVAS